MPLDLQSEFVLSTDEIHRFRRDGFILIKHLLTPEEMHIFRQAVLQQVDAQVRSARPTAERDVYGKAFVQIMHLWEKNPQISQLSLSRRIGGLIAQLFGVPRVRIYHDQVLFKEPAGGYTPWHQDSYFIPLDTDWIVTMWMPMVPITQDMGTLNFVPGSHTKGMLLEEATSDQTESFFDDYITREKLQTVQIEDMQPGDATFHLGWTIHGAPKNSTDRMREVFNVVYFADGARVIPRTVWQAATRSHMKNLQPGEVVDTDINVLVFP